MKRGGYSGDKKMELKFRGSPNSVRNDQDPCRTKRNHNGGGDEGNGRTEAQPKTG